MNNAATQQKTREERIADIRVNIADRRNKVATLLASQFTGNGNQPSMDFHEKAHR